MIQKLRNWHERRKRAVLLGHMGHAGLWCDPETGQTWQANSRWTIFPCEGPSTIDRSIKMLRDVHFCELYVDEDWPDESSKIE